MEHLSTCDFLSFIFISYSALVRKTQAHSLCFILRWVNNILFLFFGVWVILFLPCAATLTPCAAVSVPRNRPIPLRHIGVGCSRWMPGDLTAWQGGWVGVCWRVADMEQLCVKCCVYHEQRGVFVGSWKVLNLSFIMNKNYIFRVLCNSIFLFSIEHVNTAIICGSEYDGYRLSFLCCFATCIFS